MKFKLLAMLAMLAMLAVPVCVGLEIADNKFLEPRNRDRMVVLKYARGAIVRGNSPLGAKPDLTVKPETFTEKASRTRPWARRTNPLFALDAEGVDDIHLAYADEQPPVLVLSNRTDSVLVLTGGIRISETGGREIHVFDASGILSPKGVRRFPIEKGLAKGVWSAVAELETPDARAVSETRFGVVRRRSVTPPSAPGKFRAGFNYHMERYTDADNAKCLKALVQCGAKLVRAGICTRFSNVEGEHGVFDWRRADRYLGQLERSGLALNASIHGAPKWALDDRRLRIMEKPGAWAAPSRPGLLEDYARAVASRYGTRIAWYEIGNEWDLIDPEILTTDEAIRLQKEAYRGVKAGCPEAKVIPNGWAVVHSDVIPHRTQRDMQERMMTEAVDFYDAHPVHQHGPYREYRRRLAEFFAWRKAKGIIHKPWYSNETAQTTGNVVEERVAECVWQKILHAWAHGSVDYIWYNLRAIGYGPYDGEQGYGVMTGDFYPRATYAAFAGLTSCFEGLKADGIVYEGESRDSYRFAGNGRTVLVGWDLRAKSNSVIRVRTDAKRVFVADLYDNRTEVPVAGGEVAFMIGRTPSALILEGATSAVPDEEDLRRGEQKEVLNIVLGGKGHHFTLHNYDDVFEMYKADPANFDKVWKGWWDLIADIDVSIEDGRLKIQAKTNDEKLAADDALLVSVDGKDTRFPVAEPREKGAIYRGEIPCPSEDSIVEIRIEDDDGLGKEGWLTTGRFRIFP